MQNGLRGRSTIRNAYRGEGWLSDALRTVVNTTLKSVTKGGGGVKHLSKKSYVIVEQPPTKK